MRVDLAFLLTTDKIAGLPKLGAFGYWIGMCSDWVLRSVLFLTRLLTGRWRKASGLIKEPAPATVSATEGEGAEAEIEGAETSEVQCEIAPTAEKTLDTKDEDCIE